MPYYRVSITFVNRKPFLRHVYSDLGLDDYWKKTHTAAQEKYPREIAMFDCVQISTHSHVAQSMIQAGAKKWPEEPEKNC